MAFALKLPNNIYFRVGYPNQGFIHCCGARIITHFYQMGTPREDNLSRYYGGDIQRYVFGPSYGNAGNIYEDAGLDFFGLFLKAMIKEREHYSSNPYCMFAMADAAHGHLGMLVNPGPETRTEVRTVDGITGKFVLSPVANNPVHNHNVFFMNLIFTENKVS